MMSTHVESLTRFIDLGTQAGVDVILSPSLSHANMTEKMRYWRMANPDHSRGAAVGNRLAGEAHSFVSTEAVSRYNTILLECYKPNWHGEWVRRSHRTQNTEKGGTLWCPLFLCVFLLSPSSGALRLATEFELSIEAELSGS